MFHNATFPRQPSINVKAGQTFSIIYISLKQYRSNPRVLETLNYNAPHCGIARHLFPENVPLRYFMKEHYTLSLATLRPCRKKRYTFTTISITDF